MRHVSGASLKPHKMDYYSSITCTGKIVNVNKAIVELLGFSSEELLGRSLL